MFLPLYSDSEMRVWPFATGALILFNIACFFIQHQLPDAEIRLPVHPLFVEHAEGELDDDGKATVMAPGYYKYVLHHGDGLHPIQWFTSFLMHAGVFHLIGNLIFLWVFGHVVEGVVGHWLFLMLYVGLGVAQSMLEQILFLGSSGGSSLGASGAIYSLMLLAAWFSPQDNIMCLLVFFYRAFFFPIPVLMMALFYFLFDLAVSAYGGFEMSTPLLHAIGGLFGFVGGFVLLTTGLVENDRRDALSLFREARGLKPKKVQPTKRQLQEKEAKKEAAQLAHREKLKVAENSLLMHLNARNLEASLAQYHRVKRLDPNFEWTENQMKQLITLAQNNSDWNRAIELSHDYLSIFGAEHKTTATVVSLNLANLLLRKQFTPIKARKVLSTMDPNLLAPDQQRLFQRLVTESNRQIDEGELELADD